MPRIKLHDRDTWPAHANAGTGSAICPVDCLRCEIMALQEDRGVDSTPGQYYVGAFSDGSGAAIDGDIARRVTAIEEVIRGAGHGAKLCSPHVWIDDDDDGALYCIVCGTNATP